jgi:hypothetical protein
LVFDDNADSADTLAAALYSRSPRRQLWWR